MERTDSPYMEKSKKILNYAKKLYTSSNWTEQLKKNGVTLQNQVVDLCSFPVYRVTCTYNKPKEELVNKIWGVDCEEKAMKNDPKLTSWQCLSSGSDWKLISQTNAAQWPVWPRHTLFSQVRIDEDNHTYLVGSNESVDGHNDKKNHVTSYLHMSVYDFCDNDNGTTTVDRITLLDPKGSVPVSLVTKYSDNLVDLFCLWKNE
jgi:hypothetical protein